MKMITAMIQPFRLSKVTYALQEIEGFPGLTITDVRGFGREKSRHEEGAPHRVIEDFVEYVKKVRIEVVARDEMVEQIVETIKRVAHTGNRGDGKIFVWPVEHAVRIQTGEMDEAAV
ncbi:MAG TPA: P-II family nitrogen regulator [Blastocatellia bacterium]|nr:P-II family nitrogen regulator [Blastocatellia bacterium]